MATDLTRPRKYLNSTKSYPLPAYAYVWENETERLLDTLQADADIIIHTRLHDELETFRLARASCCGCAMTALLRLGRIGDYDPTDVPTNEVIQRIANDPNTFLAESAVPATTELLSRLIDQIELDKERANVQYSLPLLVSYKVECLLHEG